MRKLKKKADEAKGGRHIATLAALNQFIDWRGVDAEDRAEFTAYLVHLLPAIREEIHWLFRVYPKGKSLKIIAKAMARLAGDFPEEDRRHIGGIFITAAILVMAENPPGMIPVGELERLRFNLWATMPEELRHPQPDPITPTGQATFSSMFAGTA